MKIKIEIVHYHAQLIRGRGKVHAEFHESETRLKEKGKKKSLAEPRFERNEEFIGTWSRVVRVIRHRIGILP